MSPQEHDESFKDELFNGLGWNASPNLIDFDSGLTIYEKAVWHNFNAHANGKTKACFPTKERQAYEIGCSKDKVSTARLGLIAKGWLLKEKLIDPKTKRFIRYQWTTCTPSSRLPDDGNHGRREKPTSAKLDANNTNRLTRINDNNKKFNKEEEEILSTTLDNLIEPHISKYAPIMIEFFKNHYEQEVYYEGIKMKLWQKLRMLPRGAFDVEKQLETWKKRDENFQYQYEQRRYR